MPTSPINAVFQHLRSLLLLPEGAELTDTQLLECFVSRREPAALEALVRRHAPMVWGVCRRVLANHHDAEDAFQATFLVLVRKAGAIRSPARLGNWLYGVAHQTALKARATSARRQKRERPAIDMPEPAGTERDPSSGLQPLLDQELSRLPEKYRTVIVLCELEGRTIRETARQLGCPEGTVASRLARARTMLAKRFGRHGLALTGSVLATMLAQQPALASVPDSVLAATIKAVNSVAAGQAALGLTSPPVAALTEGVLKAMLLTKLKMVVALVLVLALTSVGVSRLFFPGPAEPQAPARDPADRKEKVPNRDWERLIGTWRVHSATVNGKGELPREDGDQNEQVIYDRDGGWQQKSAGQVLYSGTIGAINSTARPRTIDYKVLKGGRDAVGKTIQALSGPLRVPGRRHLPSLLFRPGRRPAGRLRPQGICCHRPQARQGRATRQKDPSRGCLQNDSREGHGPGQDGPGAPARDMGVCQRHPGGQDHAQGGLGEGGRPVEKPHVHRGHHALGQRQHRRQGGRVQGTLQAGPRPQAETD
jgi:RNA polymerase sigma factor (sigma-70 family)